MSTWNLTPAEYVATVAKFAKINARAARKGWTGRFEVTGKRVEKSETSVSGLPITKVYMETTITGEAPKYNGWTFLARVDVVGDSFTLAVSPGVEERVSRENVRPGECDHCGHNRARKTTYLVRNEQGETKNVGSTCLKDFLGWDGSVVFQDLDSVVSDEERSSWGSGPAMYSVETILAYAAAATKAFGFVRAGDYTATPTKQVVMAALSPVSSKDRELAQALRPYAQEAAEQVSKIADFVKSDDFDGSTYTDNAKVAVSAEYVEFNQVGILASLPQALARHNERQVRREAEKKVKSTSEYLGEVKEKITFTGTVSAIRYISGDYGTTTLYTFVTEDGNIVKWFASGTLYTGSETVYTTGFSGYDADGNVTYAEYPQEVKTEAKEGDVFTLKATVKKHEEYKGEKSTVITRAKKVD